jgi:Chaperone of endosialidase
MKGPQNQFAITIAKAWLFLAFAFVSVASAQNVGIGLSNPASKLTVNGNLAIGAGYNVAAPANGAIIQGNVGIGTTTPLEMLQVYNGNIYCNDSTGTSSILLINNDGGVRVYRNGSAYTSDSPFNNGYLDFMSTETAGVPVTRMFYYIGVSSMNPPVNAGEGLAFESGDPNGFPQMLLQHNTGNLGIGTNTPVFKLQTDGIMAVSGAEGHTYPTTGNAFSIGWDNVQLGAGIAEFVNFSGTGGGNAFDFFRVPNSGTPATANIIADINTAGAYQQISDERVKTGVKPLSYGLREILALEPKEYDVHAVQSMNDSKPKFASGEVHQFGFLAQQVVKVLPEAVEKPADPRTDFYRMGYTSFIPVLVNAVQELKHLQDETVAEQHAKITQQETKIASLESEVASLKQANRKLAAMASKLETLEKAVNNLQIKDSAKEQTVAINGDH